MFVQDINFSSTPFSNSHPFLFVKESINFIENFLLFFGFFVIESIDLMLDFFHSFSEDILIFIDQLVADDL